MDQKNLFYQVNFLTALCKSFNCSRNFMQNCPNFLNFPLALLPFKDVNIYQGFLTDSFRHSINNYKKLLSVYFCRSLEGITCI